MLFIVVTLWIFAVFFVATLCEIAACYANNRSPIGRILKKRDYYFDMIAADPRKLHFANDNLAALAEKLAKLHGVHPQSPDGSTFAAVIFEDLPYLEARRIVQIRQKEDRRMMKRVEEMARMDSDDMMDVQSP